ncbi:TPA: aldehyde ferredoxin oxidoreductase, partial [Candidatus Geothermarchaeota archaeon]|nr:aldehyde ferredoxin oxidoreductase [Candidatus Geothermarchaeota archaeon]
MDGYNGWHHKILWIDLSRGKHWVEEFTHDFALQWIGGRGFAIKILWDRIDPGIDPLAPENLLIFAVGPLTGLPLPSSGKLVVASKSPLTGGYGDGNIGTRASVQLRKAGYDAIVVTGKAEKPSYILIQNSDVEIITSPEYWGLNSEEIDSELTSIYGRRAGILYIGPAGEKLVRYSVVMSEKDRAGGRPGMGAVMGSKNLKAIVVIGDGEMPSKDPDKVREIGKEAYSDVKNAPNYNHWMREGTMGILSWCQEMSVLPTYNFREGVFDGADKINGMVMADLFKISQKGCPQCNMVCGNVGEAKEGRFKGVRAELDYENVGMLGPNLGIDNLNDIIGLVRLADNYGFDTISLGSTLAFTTEVVEKGYIDIRELDGVRPKWGDVDSYIDLMEIILNGVGFGSILKLGTKVAAIRIGRDALDFAMQVKGLDVSAYDAHIAHGMALAFGTSPIGAHHKDAWYIYREALRGFDVNDRKKVEEVIE